MGFASAHAREMHKECVRCGYTLARKDGGHIVYVREGWPIFVVPATPGDWRSRLNDMARLKRRHPEMFDRGPSQPASVRKARRKTSARGQARRASRAAQLVAQQVQANAADLAVPAPPPRPERTSCGDCGRPWMSDLDPLQYPCPDCGGAHRLGRDVA